MSTPKMVLVSLIVAASTLAPRSSAAATPTHVRFVTTLGNIDVVLRPDVAPNTVANFLAYVNAGAYDMSFFHRVATGFVAQGGGYFVAGDTVEGISTGAPVANEYNLPNVRGTLAMAKLTNQPNSATSEWFFNLTDNSAALGPANDGGFTVFGAIDPSDAASLSVMDAIAAQQLINVDNNIFSSVPVVNYSGSGTILHQNFVVVDSIDTILDPGVADFTIAAAPASLNIPDGATGSTTVTVTPVNGYQGTVKVGCGPLPDSATCIVSAGSLTFGASGAPQSFTFQLATSVSSSGSNNALAPPQGPLALGGAGGGRAAGLGAALAGLFGLALIATALRRWKQPIRVALAVTGCLALVGAGCAGSHTATPPGTYNVTLRFSDGTISHPLDVTTVVEPSPPGTGT
jgi:cyclophilin family peptidyl-prolyl cis-trans isomerase